MNPLRTRLGFLAAAIAVLAVPSAAVGENLVPPDNSAVNQYTESFPTAGGDKDSEKAKDTGVTPAQTLGAKNAKRLEAQGEEGRKVAEVAAETAPVPADPATSTPPPEPEGGDGKSETEGKGKDRQKPDEQPDSESGAGNGSGSGGGDDTPAASGSSGTGEVLGQATGLSGGQLGLLLPLILLGGLAWALAFLWRRRNQPTV
jgi:hypothetical protein